MKLDWKRNDPLYRPSLEPACARIPEMKYISIEGEGDPAGEEYQSAISSLYSVAYGIKMKEKRSPTYQDFVVPPLETRWWGAEDPSTWRWQCLIRMPEFVTDDLVRKYGNRVKLTTIAAHMAVQALHIGPYDDNTTRGRILDYIESNNKEFLNADAMCTHEIYLSDPRRVEESKLRTVIRVAVKD